VELFLFWIILSIGAILIDIFTSAFLFVWLAIGGVAAIVGGLAGLEFPAQLGIFIVVSLISMAIGYPLAKKKFKNTTETPLMEETYIGKEFLAEEEIDKTSRIKVGGIYWTGKNNGEKISKGEKFKIIGIEGNKLLIKGLREEE
jgi:membrane protein implicated in regulation of membrane protease activity